MRIKKHNKKLFIYIIIFIIGLSLGIFYNFIKTEKCDLIESGLNGCYSGCKYSNLPTSQYNSCVMFCKQNYYIEYTDNKKVCNKWQKIVR